MMKEHINSFSKGMNSDLLKIAAGQKDMYNYALNGRVLSELGSSTFSFENVKGNQFSISIPGTSNIISIHVSDADAAGLLATATYFNLYITIAGLDVINILVNDFDPNWPSLPFSSAADFYAWLEQLINDYSTSLNLNIYAYIADDRLNVTFLIDPSEIDISLTNADADFDFGPLGGGTDVTYETNYIAPIVSPVIIGYTNLRDSIILFTTDNTTQSPGKDDPSAIGQIWRLTYDDVTLQPTIKLLFNDYVDFSTYHPIQAVSRYENEGVQKVYWTDFYNYIRVFNTVDPNGFALRPDELNMFPSFDFEPAILKQIATGGQVEIGVYQASYRLKRSNGTISTLARPSNVVSIYRKADTDTYKDVVGEDFPATPNPTGKRIVWNVTTLDTSFDFIEPIVIKRTSYTSTPRVFLLDPIPVPSSGSVIIDYSGLENAEEISLEEYLLISTNFFDTCKTISTSNNMLFIANTKSTKKLDLAYDAKAYRFLPSSDDTYITPDFGDLETWGQAEDIDAVNPDYTNATWLDYHKDVDKYKFQRNSTVLGGTGPNISYEFITKSLTEDKKGQVTPPPGAPKGVVDPLSTVITNQTLNSYTYEVDVAIPNHKSGYFSGLYRGYKRGETYRFGIVFYDLRGNPGYVKWIGDIKFPRAYENQGDAFDIENTADLQTFPMISNISATEFASVQLGIKFNVSIPPETSKQITGFSIVRVKRELQDRSIVANGYLAPPIDCGAYYAHPGTQVSGERETQSGFDLIDTSSPSVLGAAPRDSVMFYSPDFLFDSNSDVASKAQLRPGSDFLYADHYLAQVFIPVDTDTGQHDYYYTKLFYPYSRFDFVNLQNAAPFNTAGKPDDPSSYYIALRSIVPIARENQLNLLGAPYSWYPGQVTGFFRNIQTRVANSTIGLGNKTTLLGLQPQAVGVSPMIFYQTGAGAGLNGDSSLGPTNSGKWVADICRLLTDQYGGNTYEARSLNDYISCGHYQRVTYNNDPDTAQSFATEIFGGDTFVNVWCNTKIHPRVQGSGSTVTSGSNFPGPQGYSIYTPVETYINTHLRHGVFYNKDGMAATGTEVGTADHEDFNYNSVYSCENDIFKYFPKPSVNDFTEVDEYDNRVYVSEVKINGETTDSWSIFRQGNYLDLDGVHGPINNILLYKDNILAFQNKAVALLNILPKFITQSANSEEEASLGTGKPLAGYSYLSTEIGCKHQWGVTKGTYNGGEAVYFFDINKKRLYKLSQEGLKPIEGLTTFFRENIRGDIQTNDNPIEFRGITCTYDSKFDEAWFTFHTSLVPAVLEGRVLPTTEPESYSVTVCYSEPIQAFSTFYSFTPQIYINTGSKIISPNPLAPQLLYMHHYGDYCNFYGTQYPVKLKFTANPDGTLRKALYAIGYIGEIIDFNGINIDGDTWNRIRVTTDYQNSDLITLIPGTNVARKERFWHVNGFRNQVYTLNGDIYDPANLISSLPSTDSRTMYPDRMRDMYFMIELEYDNTIDLTTHNRKIILPFVKTVYNTSAR